MDYKSTLNLPKTSFPMKANLPLAEPKVLERWEREDLFHQLSQRRAQSPTFILHDGPPYANGDIHIGHALNKILKDVIVRYKNMRGFKSTYVPGWDCHGLPIEYALMKELKVTKHQVDTVEFRKKARAYAHKYVGIQREQFKRLGITGDWENPYLTLAPEFVAAELKALKNLVEQGYIYRANKPVNWCWSCETALAEAEVEYDQHSSPQIWVKFKLEAASAKKLGAPAGKETYLVIWTTTPWTLMGNVAVSVHPDFEYALWEKEGQVLVTLAEIPAPSRGPLGISSEQASIKKIRGKDLEGLLYDHPFLRRQGKVVLAGYVSAEDGTGLVHTAPGFGAEDFLTGRQYKLEVLAPVDSKGQFVRLPEEVAQLNGQQVQKANPAVIELLKEKKALVDSAKLEHQYPHCWRCRNPIIFRATPQWFLNIEHENLRQKLLKIAQEQVEWFPSVGKERMSGMLKTRPDWCLSRQRLWGVPIPALTCKKCGGGWLIPETIEKFAAAVESAPDAVDRWFTEDFKQWIPEGLSCLDCGAEEFVQGKDILDVWFDSGMSHRGVLRLRKELTHPADMYLEGSDQHRGWFQVSMITGAALDSKAPYKAVLTHGFVVDGQGRKMSKSLGNVVNPQQVISAMGADVLRLWVASSDYAEDVRLSQTILSQSAEAYRKIRNTIRFCLANLNLDKSGLFSMAGDGLIFPKDFQFWNRWVLVQLAELERVVSVAYEQYAFHRVVRAIYEFCTVTLSNFYLDLIKDCLYSSHPDSKERREIQTVLAHIVYRLALFIAPILPMTAEEIWAAFPVARGEGSIHLQEWPSPLELDVDESTKSDWERLLKIREAAMKELEKAREAGLIGDSLEAELELSIRDEELWKFLGAREQDLALACIVSVLSLKKGNGSGENLTMVVRKSPGSKCERCWMRLPTVGKSSQHPGLCHRCIEVVQKLVV